MKKFLESIKTITEISGVAVAFFMAVVVILTMVVSVSGWIRHEVLIHQELPKVRDRFNNFFNLPQTTFIDEYLGWAVCGNSDVSSAVYTRLYSSRLPQSEIASHFSPTGQIRVYFIDNSESRVSPKSEPCFYYVLFDGLNIPPVSSVSSSETLFIIYGFANEINEQVND